MQLNKLEAAVLALCRSIPLSLGRKVRRLAYRMILGRVGRSVQIDLGVDFTCGLGIELGNNVRIERDARLRCFGLGSKICLRDHSTLDRGVDIKTHQTGAIEIGSYSYIGPYTCLSGDYIKIGNNCLIASHSSIYANNHNFADVTIPIRDQGNSYKGIVIEDDCWLGSGVRVLDGVTIGKGSVVGAGAVVTKSIPPYSIAVGVPAKVISRREVPPNEVAELSANYLMN
ncbi:acyltransferase [Oculatella sp. LEGE 06141]|uniref:acyltransferase n=1 Tax=Oculatella sp. LEGE 06141 TaxID=1828648 RepID=UPI0018823B28|nr:acyltransferase [Oculatella sp. LEGE 06141]MBE9178908.1 acyltransferase [Oculatella sp. LEGE 06141]